MFHFKCATGLKHWPGSIFSSLLINVVGILGLSDTFLVWYLWKLLPLPFNTKIPKSSYDNNNLKGYSSDLTIDKEVSLLLVNFIFFEGSVGSFNLLSFLLLLLELSFRYFSLCLAAILPLYDWHLFYKIIFLIILQYSSRFNYHFY